jgi:polar amino acid transport system substrate-binding protein
LKKKFVFIWFFLLTLFVPTLLPGQTLRVAYKIDPPFYHYVDDEGESQGLHIDLIRAVAQQSQTELIFIPQKTLYDAINLLDTGQADVVLGVHSSIAESYLATIEISTSKLSVLAEKEFSKKYSSGQVQNYTISFELATANVAIIPSFLSSKFYVTGSQLEVLENNFSGRGDLMVCDKDCMTYLLHNLGIEEHYSTVYKSIGVVGYTMIVGRGNTSLLRTLNEGILEIRMNGTYDKILSSWVIEEESSSRWLFILKMVLLIAVFIGVVGAVYVYLTTKIRNYLRKEVITKTLELDAKVHQLEKEKSLSDGVILSSPFGMTILNVQDMIIGMNPAACLLTGLSAPLLGHNIKSLPLFGSVYREHDHNQFPIEDKILKHTDQENKTHSYRYSIRKIVVDDPRSDVLITFEDITEDEEKKLAAIERERNRILNQLMAGIAHEVKNTLAGIRNFAQLAPSWNTDPEFVENFSTLVPQEVDRVTNLVDSLVHHARPIIYNPGLVDISILAKECAYLAQISVKGYPIVVRTTLESPAIVWVDGNQMKQALINITMNSISSMKRRLSRTNNKERAGGKDAALSALDELVLEIQVRVNDSEISLLIRDQGEGMEEDVLSRCTDPFFTTKSTGTGLGLALSKQIILENQGKLEIHSTPGVGTETLISLQNYSKSGSMNGE